jgi:hypothetical protein
VTARRQALCSRRIKEMPEVRIVGLASTPPVAADTRPPGGLSPSAPSIGTIESSAIAITGSPAGVVGDDLRFRTDGIAE